MASIAIFRTFYYHKVKSLPRYFPGKFLCIWRWWQQTFAAREVKFIPPGNVETHEWHRMECPQDNSIWGPLFDGFILQTHKFIFFSWWFLRNTNVTKETQKGVIEVGDCIRVTEKPVQSMTLSECRIMQKHQFP